MKVGERGIKPTNGDENIKQTSAQVLKEPLAERASRFHAYAYKKKGVHKDAQHPAVAPTAGQIGPNGVSFHSLHSSPSSTAV